MKKLLCLVMALAMLLGSMSALAEETETEVTYGPKLGVTLYTLRHKWNEMRDAALAEGKSNQEAATEALTSMLHTIADMGYKGYQPNWQDPNWWDMPASELKALNEELGLTLISPHWMTAWYCEEEELEWILNYCVEAGATGISLDVNMPSSSDGWTVSEKWSNGQPLTAKMMDAWVKHVIEQIHYMQDKIDAMGYHDVLRVGMHTHSLEWIPIQTYGGRYFIDILYDEFGDTVDLHFDTSRGVPQHGLGCHLSRDQHSGCGRPGEVHVAAWRPVQLHPHQGRGHPRTAHHRHRPG